MGCSTSSRRSARRGVGGACRRRDSVSTSTSIGVRHFTGPHLYPDAPLVMRLGGETARWLLSLRSGGGLGSGDVSREHATSISISSHRLTVGCSCTHTSTQAGRAVERTSLASASQSVP